MQAVSGAGNTYIIIPGSVRVNQKRAAVAAAPDGFCYYFCYHALYADTCSNWLLYSSA
jgi:hypothetical protein